MRSKPFPLRWAKDCAECSGPISVGDYVHFDDDEIICESCARMREECDLWNEEYERFD